MIHNITLKTSLLRRYVVKIVVAPSEPRCCDIGCFTCKDDGGDRKPMHFSRRDFLGKEPDPSEVHKRGSSGKDKVDLV